MNYTRVVKGFNIEWEALEKLSKKTRLDFPILSKTHKSLRWIDSFKDCLYSFFGVMDLPLLYGILDHAQFPDEFRYTLQYRWKFGDSGYFVDELIACLGHAGSLYKSYNTSVYSFLKEVTWVTIYTPTIKPYAI